MKRLLKPWGSVILACLILSSATKIIRHHHTESEDSDSSSKKAAADSRHGAEASQETQKTQTAQKAQEFSSGMREIYYAGGCFWGVESYFSQIPGVYNVTVGYANGSTENPSYEEVCRHTTGHAETVHVLYDPALVSLKTLTEHFFKIINPLSVNRQGNDIGDQYRTGIYYTDESDLETLKGVMDAEQKKYNSPIAVELLPLTCYYLAEEYHQDYLVKNPGGYCHVDFSGLAEFKNQG